MTKQIFVYLPSPYEDELLYSVVARYCTQSVQRVHKLSCELFGKCFLILRADLPCSLETVAERTKYCWGMSGETILSLMTLFPYYEPFIPNTLREKRKHALLSGQCRSTIGVKAYKVAPPQFMRLCVQCSELDRQEFEETYWRRVHQLPGVLVCPDHGIPLVSTPVQIQPHRTECIDASSAGIVNVELLAGIKMELVQKIAKRCRDILLAKKIVWEVDVSPRAYREAALERGLRRLPGIFSPTIFSEQFIDHYGVQLLTKLGMGNKINDTSWFSCIFQKNAKQVFHPLQHILVQLFLESLPKIAVAHPLGLGPWMCPNPYAAHADEESPIKSMSMRTRPNKTCYCRMKCSCGFVFTTTGVHDKNPRLPLVDKVWSFGVSRFRFAQTLMQKGSTLKKTAKALAVSISHLKQILLRGSTEAEVAPGTVLEARHEWLELLKQDPEGRVTVARKKRVGLYQFLRKHDQEWFLQQKPLQRLHVNWEKRDVEWSQLIVNTARRLGEGAPKTVVAKEAGLNLRVFSQFDRLPLCAKALTKGKD